MRVRSRRLRRTRARPRSVRFGSLCLAAVAAWALRIMLPHGRQPVLLEEHVLGAAQADALRAEGAGTLGVARVVGVRPHLQAAHAIGPAQEGGEVVLVLEAGLDRRQLAGEDLAGGAVDADDVALLDADRSRAHLALGVVDLQRLGTRDAGQAHRARDDRRVRGRAAARRQHALRGQHAVHVVRAGLDPHQDDRVAGLLRRDRAVRIEDRLADGSAGRRVEALAQQSVPHRRLCRLVEARQQQLHDLRGIDALNRLLPRDQVLAGHVDRDLHRRRRRALAGSGLEHVERAALDRELEVLHVAVVALEALRDLLELGVDLRHLVAHLADLGRRPNARPRRPRPARWSGTRRRAPSRRCSGRA